MTTLRERLLRLLRVPHAPSAPAGDENIRVFRAAPKYYGYRLVRWVLTNSGALIGLLWSLATIRGASWWTGEGGSVSIGIPANFQVPGSIGSLSLASVFAVLEVIGIIGVAVHAVASLALLRLDFEQRWYIVSDRSLRIRAGLVRMREKTMTFANIQHVTLKQGPLQRLLGIADLQVRTAGGGGAGDEKDKNKDDLHVAYFRGLADAEHIRDSIRERLRRYADAGLGDPDDGGSEVTSATARAPSRDASSAGQRPVPTALVEAARALADEAALLRARLSESTS